MVDFTLKSNVLLKKKKWIHINKNSDNTNFNKNPRRKIRHSSFLSPILRQFHLFGFVVYHFLLFLRRMLLSRLRDRLAQRESDTNEKFECAREIWIAGVGPEPIDHSVIQNGDVSRIHIYRACHRSTFPLVMGLSHEWL